jgi:hypothetical protein
MAGSACMISLWAEFPLYFIIELLLLKEKGTLLLEKAKEATWGNDLSF